MDSHLQHLASRVEEDPFFLACPLRLYATSEDLDDEKLATALGCSEETLMLVRLCRTPREEPAQFRDDIDRIVARFQVNPSVLREAVRRGQSIIHMRKKPAGDTGSAVSPEFFMAARDGEEKQEPTDKEGGGP
jgi:hypothetical protein